MKFYILLSTFSILLFSCGTSNDNKQDIHQPSVAVTQKDTGKVIEKAPALPFIGKKAFEMRPGYSGTGTAHKFIEIKPDGEVYFSFVQMNQADGTETKETYYAGKFKPYMTSIFKEWNNEITEYEITADKIYEVDKNHNRITSEDCCNRDNESLKEKCPCESGYESAEYNTEQ
jgi:hypothetical protein